MDLYLKFDNLNVFPLLLFLFIGPNHPPFHYYWNKKKCLRKLDIIIISKSECKRNRIMLTFREIREQRKNISMVFKSLCLVISGVQVYLCLSGDFFDSFLRFHGTIHFFLSLLFKLIWVGFCHLRPRIVRNKLKYLHFVLKTGEIFAGKTSD